MLLPSSEWKGLVSQYILGVLPRSDIFGKCYGLYTNLHSLTHVLALARFAKKFCFDDSIFTSI